jgi:alkylglycerol monooxygenase
MDLIVYAIPVFFLLIGVELMIQYITKSPLYRFNDAITNINCGITQQVLGVFFRTATFFLYLWIYDHARIFTVPLTWYTWILLFIGVDFFYYLFHRYAHEIAAFWGSHAVHHQSEEYNFSVALRQSATQVFFSFWFYLPLAFLGFSPVAFITVASLQTLYQFWIHTRVIKKMPAWFEFIFNTPSHHRVHHGADPKYIDKNHGGTLIIFDRMFGTFVEEEEEVHYGVTKPVQSWDPIWVNVEYYKWLWQTFMAAKGMDKWRVLSRKPGWRPDYLGGPLTPQEIPDTFQKYDVHAGTAMHVYVLIQFIIVLSGTSLFLFSADKLPLLQQLASAALIIWMVQNISGIFERKSWVFVSETLRIVASLIFAETMIPAGSMALHLSVAAAAIFIFMIFLTLYQAERKGKWPIFAKQVK